MTSYFQPTISIDSDNVVDHSLMLGLVPTLIMPAEVNRLGFMLQNLSDTNDVWWGYDEQVGILKPGYFCLTATPEKRLPYLSPAHGGYRGAIYAISDGGSRVTAKSWLQL